MNAALSGLRAINRREPHYSAAAECVPEQAHRRRASAPRDADGALLRRLARFCWTGRLRPLIERRGSAAVSAFEHPGWLKRPV